MGIAETKDRRAARAMRMNVRMAKVLSKIVWRQEGKTVKVFFPLVRRATRLLPLKEENGKRSLKPQSRLANERAHPLVMSWRRRHTLW
jgi:hypothetical protein